MTLTVPDIAPPAPGRARQGLAWGLSAAVTAATDLLLVTMAAAGPLGWAGVIVWAAAEVVTVVRADRAALRACGPAEPVPPPVRAVVDGRAVRAGLMAPVEVRRGVRDRMVRDADGPVLQLSDLAVSLLTSPRPWQVAMGTAVVDHELGHLALGHVRPGRRHVWVAVAATLGATAVVLAGAATGPGLPVAVAATVVRQAGWAATAWCRRADEDAADGCVEDQVALRYAAWALTGPTSLPAVWATHRLPGVRGRT